MQHQTLETIETPRVHAAAEEAADFSAITTTTDLAAWYSQDEACKLLGMSPRTLNEKLQRRQIVIQKTMRPIEGRRPEPCFYPADVDREVLKLRAKAASPAIFRPESGVGPRQESTANLPAAPPAASLDLVQLVDRFAQRALDLVRPAHPPVDKGPWLTIKAAAAHSGLSEGRIRRVVRHMVESGHPDVILDVSLKIRRAAVEGIDAAAMKAADEAERAASPRKQVGGPLLRRQVAELAAAV